MRFSEKSGGVILSYVQMVLNVLVKFIYTPFLLRALGQSEYGLFSLVMSIIGYLSILDLGFGGTVTRYTVKYRAENDKEKLHNLYGTLSAVYIIIGLIALFVCFALNYFSSSLFGETMSDSEISKLKIMLLLVGVNLLFSFPLQISASVIAAYEKFIFKNGINLIRTILQPIVMILLLFLINMKAIGAITVVTIFNFITYFLYYVYSVKKVDFKFSINNFDKDLIRAIVSFSIWMFLMMVFEQLQFNSGQFIIGLFNGTDIIAIWGIAMIFVLNFRSLATAISNVFAPSLMQMYFQKNEEGANAVIYRMIHLQAVILFYILFNYLLFGRPFIELWAGTTYVDAFTCSVIVMIPMTIALILDFCYWSQVADNKFVFRTVTMFSSLIVAFVIIYLLMRVSLLSYSIFMALSIIVGQILFVVVYIKKNMSVSLKEVFRNMGQVVFPLFTVYLLGFFFFKLLDIHIWKNSGILQLITDILFFNVVMTSTTWFFSLNREERAKLHA